MFSSNVWHDFMNVWVWGTLILAFKKVLANGAIWLGKKAIMDSERKAAIWEHYLQGHVQESVLDCHTDKCRVFMAHAS